MTANFSIKPPPIAKRGESLAQVSTPALLIELDAFEHNIAHMADMARQHGVALRPHAKAHKSSVIARGRRHRHLLPKTERGLSICGGRYL